MEADAGLTVRFHNSKTKFRNIWIKSEELPWTCWIAISLLSMNLQKCGFKAVIRITAHSRTLHIGHDIYRTSEWRSGVRRTTQCHWFKRAVKLIPFKIQSFFCTCIFIKCVIMYMLSIIYESLQLLTLRCPRTFGSLFLVQTWASLYKISKWSINGNIHICSFRLRYGWRKTLNMSKHHWLFLEEETSRFHWRNFIKKKKKKKKLLKN